MRHPSILTTLRLFLFLTPYIVTTPTPQSTDKGTHEPEPVNCAAGSAEPYCPAVDHHSPQRPQSPSPQILERWPLNSTQTITWNKNFYRVATETLVDVYFCPKTGREGCQLVQEAEETVVQHLEFTLDDEIYSEGIWYPVVVVSGQPLPESDNRDEVRKSAEVNVVEDPVPERQEEAADESKQDSESAATASEQRNASAARTRIEIWQIVLIIFACLLMVGFIFLILFCTRRRKLKMRKKQIRNIQQANMQAASNPQPLASADTKEAIHPSPVSSFPGPLNGAKAQAAPEDAAIDASFSNREALLIANTFKSALKRPMGDESDDEDDIATMIETMGQPVPVGAPNSAAVPGSSNTTANRSQAGSSRPTTRNGARESQVEPNRASLGSRQTDGTHNSKASFHSSLSSQAKEKNERSESKPSPQESSTTPAESEKEEQVTVNPFLSTGERKSNTSENGSRPST